MPTAEDTAERQMTGPADGVDVHWNRFIPSSRSGSGLIMPHMDMLAIDEF